MTRGCYIVRDKIHDPCVVTCFVFRETESLKGRSPLSPADTANTVRVNEKGECGRGRGGVLGEH